jgi:large subunit ribosomal protein L30
MATLRITQVKSTNGTNPRQKGALQSLGLGRIGKTVERPDHPTVIGAVRSVQHLIKIEEV